MADTTAVDTARVIFQSLVRNIRLWKRLEASDQHVIIRWLRDNAPKEGSVFTRDHDTM